MHLLCLLRIILFLRSLSFLFKAPNPFSQLCLQSHADRCTRAAIEQILVITVSEGITLTLSLSLSLSLQRKKAGADRHARTQLKSS